MTYRKSAFCGASLFLWMTSAVFGQAPGAVPGASKLEFEVASVKPAAPMTAGFMRIGMRVDAGRMDYENVTLRDCIRAAWRLMDFQISGPEWLSTTRFDIVAKLPEGATKDQVPEMLQALLADRFKLVVHHESKSHDTFTLVVAKGGPKLTAAAPDDPAGDPHKDHAIAFGGPSAGSGGGGGAVHSEAAHTTFSATSGGGGGAGVAFGGVGAGGTMKMQLKKQTLTAFADTLGRFLGSPVTDLTEIQGTYDFTLEMSMEDLTHGSGIMIMKGPAAGHAPAAGGDAANPAGDAQTESGGIFRSVQNYGLKLDKRKAPMDLLVIDRIEKTPTEN